MKTLIYGGRVIDPASRVDGKLNLLIEDGKIAWVGRETPDADITINAGGKIVSPGFIDIHMHEDPVINGKIRQCIFPMMLRQGVTTAVGGNCGDNVYDPLEYLKIVEENGAAVNVALFAGHEFYRTAAGAKDIYKGTTEGQKREMEAGLRAALAGGCVGVSFGLRYVPGADKEEFFRAAACCKDSGKLIASHVRDDADAIFDAIDEFCEAGVAYGLPVQISHIGSMGGFGQMEEVLRQIDGYKLRGLDIAMDCYPYFAFSTHLGATTYDPGWLERYHCDYGVLEFCEGKYKGQRATAETFAELRRAEPDILTVCYVMREEDIRRALGHPAVMLGSDGVTNQGQGHPRAAGAFPRFLAEFSRKGEISLYDAIEKMTAMPAERLGLTNKGRLSVGSDADIVIFDYETIQDRATFAEPALAPVGIEYVLIGGEIALEKGEILKDNCGNAVRKW